MTTSPARSTSSATSSRSPTCARSPGPSLSRPSSPAAPSSTPRLTLAPLAPQQDPLPLLVRPLARPVPARRRVVEPHRAFARRPGGAQGSEPGPRDAHQGGPGARGEDHGRHEEAQGGGEEGARGGGRQERVSGGSRLYLDLVRACNALPRSACCTHGARESTLRSRLQNFLWKEPRSRPSQAHGPLVPSSPSSRPLALASLQLVAVSSVAHLGEDDASFPTSAALVRSPGSGARCPSPPSPSSTLACCAASLRSRPSFSLQPPSTRLAPCR